MSRTAAIVQLETRFYRERKRKPYFLEFLDGEKTALEIYFDRLKQVQVVDKIIVFTSTEPEDDGIVELCKSLGIKEINRFSYEGVLEKKPAYQRHNWGIASDTGAEYFLGQWFSRFPPLENFESILYIPPDNLLFDVDLIHKAFRFHIENEFDYTYPDGVFQGCYFSFFTSELIRGLNKTDSLRQIRGGVPSAVIHKLYPFKMGILREDVFRNHTYYDLSLRSFRNFEFLKKSRIFECKSYQDIKDRAAQWHETYFDFPRVIHLEASSHCDFKCSFCPNPVLKRAKGDLEFSTFEKILEECLPYSEDLLWRFSGFGEPTQHERLVDMVRGAGERGAMTHLITNGSAMTAEMSGALVSAKLKAITFSMEGHTPELHQKFRPEIPFAKLQTHVQNLVKIRDLGPQLPLIMVQIVKFNETDPHLTKFLEYFEGRSNNVPQVNYFPFSYRSNSIEWMMITGYSTYHGLLPEKEDLDYTPFFRNPCKHETERAMILSNGDLVHCHMDVEGKFPEGNLADNSLKSLWQGGEKRARIQNQLKGEFHATPRCGSCQDWYQN